MVPSYLFYYGPHSFLWFSNLALLTGLLAAWLENRWLASMALVATLLPELGWIVSFVGGLAGVAPLRELVSYMFDPGIPLFMRALSLYHLPLPFVLFWMTWRLGYEPRAWRLLLLVGYGVLLLSFLLAAPGRSVNWVLGPVAGEPQPWLPPLAWLGLVMAGFTLVWWLTHRFVARVTATNRRFA
ncbi:hypothetical protein [Wenzhouxiangella sp. XN24]|uniref:hypothetical protein n=1 Tax=Wenzhouxiangella sp. XN24 TaxID=2713569 RepID=UPI001F0F8A51|nr:hypothetical protein [Wenzhouxiangella sp. XN24]